jgi:gamma-glutamylcyclotransferase (GGCT)/AIG2-like uncharacterized protein YtfP
MNLFAYGTLMFPEVWERIAVGEFPSEPATLPGFAIYRVKEAVFPGIVRAKPQDRVEGLVFRGLHDEALFELDAYESDLYDRIPVIVATAQGPLDCTAYVIPESNRQALTHQPWNAAWFQEHQLQRYLNG